MTKTSSARKALFAGISLLTVYGIAQAQSLVSNASPDEIVRMLGGGGALQRKWNFQPTAAPEAGTHKCQTQAPGLSAKLAVEPASEAIYASDESTPGKLDMQIIFVSGSDQIDRSSAQLLSNVASALNSPGLAQALLAVAGHTDRQGDETPAGRLKNLQLSCARALAVRARLIEQGVDGRRLAAYGFGSTRPIDPSSITSAQNRRVELRRAN